MSAETALVLRARATSSSTGGASTLAASDASSVSRACRLATKLRFSSVASRGV